MDVSIFLYSVTPSGSVFVAKHFAGVFFGICKTVTREMGWLVTTLS
jgi:hypothetical protein